MSDKKKQQKPLSDGKIAFLIVTMILLAFAASVLSPTNDHYDPAGSHKSTPDKGYSEALVFIPEKPKSIEGAKQAYTDQEKEQYAASRSDLAAQWATARYTFVGLVMGGMGLFFIIVTLRESSKAAYFAEQALFETKQNSKRELKSYITSSEIVGGKIPSTPSINAIVTLKFQNDGSTPASNIKVLHRWVRLNSEPDGTDEFRNSKIISDFEISDIDKSTLGSNKTISAHIRQTTEMSRIRVVAGHYIAVLELKIFFSNIYGERWCNHHFFSIGNKNSLEEKEAYQYETKHY